MEIHSFPLSSSSSSPSLTWDQSKQNFPTVAITQKLGISPLGFFLGLMHRDGPNDRPALYIVWLFLPDPHSPPPPLFYSPFSLSLSLPSALVSHPPDFTIQNYAKFFSGRPDETSIPSRPMWKINAPLIRESQKARLIWNFCHVTSFVRNSSTLIFFK